MIEIWMRDEYGQSSIQGRFAEFEKVIEKAFEVLDSHNTDNALTAAEKEKNWECYLPWHENSNDFIDGGTWLYGGKVRGNVDFFFNTKTKSIQECKSARIILGKINNNTWYATDHKKKEITSLNDDGLKNKAFIFFKQV